MKRAELEELLQKRVDEIRTALAKEEAASKAGKPSDLWSHADQLAGLLKERELVLAMVQEMDGGKR